MRQKSGVKGKGKEKGKKKVLCNSKEKWRHERIYRKENIVGKSSSHRSKKGKSREVALGVEVAAAMRGKSKQLP